MRYAEFYHDSTGWNGKDFSGPVTLIPACGSDSVLTFDGRWNMARCCDAARARITALNKALGKGYKGFTINAGESFTRSNTIRKLETV
jgi:hypothetical protein